MEDKLVKETDEKDMLGKLYEDKEYLKFLVAKEGSKNILQNNNYSNGLHRSFSTYIDLHIMHRAFENM